MSKSIYLDYAAATPPRDEVLEAMQPYFHSYHHNPSAIYLDGRAARRELDNIRGRAARVLGAKTSEIIFTSGASEANNLAVQGVMRSYPETRILISPLEHDSVYEPARLFKHQLLGVSPVGITASSQLSAKLSDETVLVSVLMVSNEIGSVQPLRELAEVLSRTRRDRQKRGVTLPLYLHTDAAQAGNYFDLSFSRLGVDLMTINGGKLYGPKQSGVLFVKAGTQLSPLILGGGQELGLRAGTESLAAAAGVTTALELAQAGRKAEFKRAEALKQFFATQLQKHLPSSVINGSLEHSSPHLLSVTFPGIDNERLLMELDEVGVQVGMGSACSASSDKPSRTLTAIGVPAEDIRASLRFSLGRATTQKELELVLKKLAQTPSLIA